MAISLEFIPKFSMVSVPWAKVRTLPTNTFSLHISNHVPSF